MDSHEPPECIEDIFVSSLNLEDTHQKEGYNEGYADGLGSGQEEGRQVGLKTGFKIGEELGFYSGCINVWNSVIQMDSNCFSKRVGKSMKQMEDLLLRYPFSDPEDESSSEILDSIRVKFKAICVNLCVELEYNGYPKASDEEKIQF